MKKSILLVAMLTGMLLGYAQNNVFLTITHKLGASNFAFNQASQNDLSQNFKITRVDYYISSIKIIHDGGMETAVPNKYILAKGIASVNAFLGSFNVTNVEGVKFSIGVDAPTNNADPTLWLAPHVLSPQSPSMHWGWASGYRFIALEGKAGSAFNTTFQMHGLGNANYFSQTQMAAGVVTSNSISINLNADYDEALKGINVNAGPIDHGVDATDLTVIENFRDFVFSPSAIITTGINKLEVSNKVTLYPNPSDGNFKIDLTESLNKISQIEITDILGRHVNFLPVNSSIVEAQLLQKGCYFIKFLNGTEVMTNKKLIIE